MLTQSNYKTPFDFIQDTKNLVLGKPLVNTSISQSLLRIRQLVYEAMLRVTLTAHEREDYRQEFSQLFSGAYAKAFIELEGMQHNAFSEAGIQDCLHRLIPSDKHAAFYRRFPTRVLFKFRSITLYQQRLNVSVGGHNATKLLVFTDGELNEVYEKCTTLFECTPTSAMFVHSIRSYKVFYVTLPRHLGNTPTMFGHRARNGVTTFITQAYPIFATLRYPHYRCVNQKESLDYFNYEVHNPSLNSIDTLPINVVSLISNCFTPSDDRTAYSRSLFKNITPLLRPLCEQALTSVDALTYRLASLTNDHDACKSLVHSRFLGGILFAKEILNRG